MRVAIWVLILFTIIDGILLYFYLTNTRLSETNGVLQNTHCGVSFGTSGGRSTISRQCLGDVVYVVDGISYTIPFNDNQSVFAPSFVNGDSVKVYYDERNPADGSTTGRWQLLVFICIFSATIVFILGRELYNLYKK
jgi:hypothetical protein